LDAEDSPGETISEERREWEKVWIVHGSLDRWFNHMRIAGLPEWRLTAGRSQSAAKGLRPGKSAMGSTCAHSAVEPEVLEPFR
jgi:hypothetical protein